MGVTQRERAHADQQPDQTRAGRDRPEQQPYAYEFAILAEVFMMLDFVAATPTLTLANLSVRNPWHRERAELRTVGSGADLSERGPELGYLAILKKLNCLKAALRDPQSASEIKKEELAFIQLVRDAVGQVVRPATGLTIAYTTLVVGSRRAGVKNARWDLAGQAYRSLGWPARRHRWSNRLMIALVLIMTAGAAWESAKVALGKSLLHNLQDLRTQQTAIAAEKIRVSSKQEDQGRFVFQPIEAAGGVAGAMALQVDICDRPTAYQQIHAARDPVAPWPRDGAGRPLSSFDSPPQESVCNRDQILATQFDVAHHDLKQFTEYWPAMVGTGFRLVADQVSRLIPSPRAPAVAGTKTRTLPPDYDIELRMAPVLLVLGNYLLPVIFAVVGAAASVVLDFYGKVCSSLLAPRDHILSWIRLVLGLAIGTCIGLFFSAYAPPPKDAATDLISALTLTASGIAFLAGFGVEGVFSCLQQLVRRVFGAPQSGTERSKPAPADGPS